MRNLLRKIYRSMLVIAIIMLLTLAALIVVLEAHLPSVESLRDVKLQVPLRIFTADGKLLGEFGEKRRSPVGLQEIPEDLINAILATEDRRFFEHPGFDLRGIIRAAVTLIAKGKKEQGGSTITQQVARDIFLTRDKTFIRKIKEILLAIKIESELSKEEILELYLNKTYFGKGAYGIKAAAEVYYGCNLDKLSLAQMAMLAGLPQAPSAINPLHSKEAALKRRNHVLERMYADAFITEEQFQTATNEPLAAEYHERQIEIEAPYIAEMIRKKIIDEFGERAYYEGFEVTTTIDSKLQQFANAALLKGLLEYEERHGFKPHAAKLKVHADANPTQQLKLWQEELKSFPTYYRLLFPAVVTIVESETIWVMLKNGEHKKLSQAEINWIKKNYMNKNQALKDLFHLADVIYFREENKKLYLEQIPEIEGALVALRPQTGEVRALVGGFDFARSNYNRAIQAERQPGSTFKPFIYAAALDNGYTTASIINDAPIVEDDPLNEQDWRPQNYTKQFYGPTRLRVGMLQSRNLVTIRLLKDLGLDKVVDYLTKFGFDPARLPKGLSLALGTASITPLELGSAYCIFANGGFKVTPSFIKKITCHGQSYYEASDYHKTQVISPQIAYLITSLLQDYIQSGIGQAAMQLGRRDLAGKTGTTSDHFDAWYAGYNADLVAVSWIGFDEPKSIKEYSVRAALPIWMHFMGPALQDQAEHSPVEPTGLVRIKIDPETGLKAMESQQDAIYEIFLESNVPTQIATKTHSESTVESTESIF